MPENKRVLAFMAHPDDVEILCAGTLIKLQKCGWDVHIITATAGDCGTMNHSTEEISQIRKQEAADAAALINGQYYCLEEKDGLVCYIPETIKHAVNLFRTISPSLVLTHNEFDYNQDHVMVYNLARAASFMYNTPNFSDVPITVPGQPPHLYYADSIGGVDIYGKAMGYSSYVDISTEITLKSEMLACHKSQRNWLKDYHGVDNYISDMQDHSASRGAECQSSYAEAFIQHLGHGFPQNDILQEMFQNT